jgi:hypothetical protein
VALASPVSEIGIESETEIEVEYCLLLAQVYAVHQLMCGTSSPK